MRWGDFVKKIIENLKKNPYDEQIAKQEELLKKNPNTPNLAKLAYYCGCEVEDIVKEIQFILQENK